MLSATAGSTSRIFFVLLGHRQHGQRHRAARGAHGDVDLVIGVGGSQRGLADVGLALVVLLDHHQLASGHGERAAGGVFQPHVEADDGLLGIGLQRAGLAGDEGDPDVLALRPGAAAAGGQGQRGQGEGDRATMHAASPCKGDPLIANRVPTAPNQCKP